MSQNNQYNTIEEALRDLREGKVILVTDDPDRENEGDLVCLQWLRQGSVSSESDTC